MTAYVQDKVIDALKAAKGVRAAAKRRLAAQCATDQQLLLDMVAPHLSGIIDHALQHYSNAQLASMAPARTAAAAIRPAPAAPAGQNNTMGEDLLRRFAGQNTPVFGMDDPNQGTGKRPAASARHRAAIDQIAKRIDPPLK